MATERVVEREVPVEREREVHVVHDGPTESAGMGVGGIVLALVLLAAVVLGGVFLMNMSRSEAVKDNAIAGAANSVGDAASSVGDAAGNVAEAVTPN
jgi:hypothetical protein